MGASIKPCLGDTVYVSPDFIINLDDDTALLVWAKAGFTGYVSQVIAPKGSSAMFRIHSGSQCLGYVSAKALMTKAAFEKFLNPPPVKKELVSCATSA